MVGYGVSRYPVVNKDFVHFNFIRNVIHILYTKYTK